MFRDRTFLPSVVLIDADDDTLDLFRSVSSFLTLFSGFMFHTRHLLVITRVFYPNKLLYTKESVHRL